MEHGSRWLKKGSGVKVEWALASPSQRRDAFASEAALAMLESPSQEMAQAVLAGLVASGWDIASGLWKRDRGLIEQGDCLAMALAAKATTHPDSDLAPAAKAMAALGVDFLAKADGEAAMSLAAKLGNQESFWAMGQAGADPLGDLSGRPCESPMVGLLSRKGARSGARGYQAHKEQQAKVEAWCWAVLEQACASGRVSPTAWLPSVGCAMLGRPAFAGASDWGRFWRLCAAHGVDGSQSMSFEDLSQAFGSAAAGLGASSGLGDPTLAMALAYQAGHGNSAPWKAAIYLGAKAGFSPDARSLGAACAGFSNLCAGQSWSCKEIWGKDFSKAVLASGARMLALPALDGVSEDMRAELPAAMAMAAMLAPSRSEEDDEGMRPDGKTAARIGSMLKSASRILEGVGYESLPAQGKRAFCHAFGERFSQAAVGVLRSEYVCQGERPGDDDADDPQGALALGEKMDLAMQILARLGALSEAGKALALHAHRSMSMSASRLWVRKGAWEMEDLPLEQALGHWALSWRSLGWSGADVDACSEMIMVAKRRLPSASSESSTAGRLDALLASIAAWEIQECAAPARLGKGPGRI